MSAAKELLLRPQPAQEREASRKAAKGARGGKMGPGTLKGEAPNLRLGIESSDTTRFAHKGLLEGKDGGERGRKDGFPRAIFSLNARRAEEAREKAEGASRRRWEKC
jgi:hypothetical protein